MNVRRPAVAGQFYEADEEELRRRIKDCFLHRLGPGNLPPAPPHSKRIFGFVLPHAGYMYSGPVAAHGYHLCSALQNVDLAIVVGPNHWGIGSGVATYPGDYWMTPFGEIAVDKEAAKELVKRSGIVDFDEEAHAREHSIEVHIPFLQFIFGGKLKFVPVCMALQDMETAVQVGEALASLAEKTKAILIASSDWTHYESHESASKKDARALEVVSKLDVPGHYTTIQRLNVSACGYGPVAAVVTAAKKLGASRGTLLKYATSGDVTADYDSVVGYAAMVFE